MDKVETKEISNEFISFDNKPNMTYVIQDSPNPQKY